MTVTPAPKRRTILKGAAWSTPVIAAVIGAPAAVASNGDGAVPNDQANFYWAPSAGADFSTLAAQPGDRTVEYSTQISYSDLGVWPVPPLTGQFQLRITFDVPVTLQSVPGSWTLAAPAAGMGPTNTFMFHATPTTGGHNLNAKFAPGHTGQVTAVSSMSLLNGGFTTWAQEPAVSTADFAPDGARS